MLADSPGGLWMMDTTTDDSGNGRTLTFNNSPATVSSIIPTVTTDARDLNGSNQNATTADAASLDLGDVFTLEAWFITDTVPASGAVNTMIYKDLSYQLCIFNNGGEGPKMWMNRPGTALLAKHAATISTATLYCGIATKNGASIAMYLNATEGATSITNSTAVDTTNALFLGSSSSPSEFFNGRLQALAVYPTALSPTRVQAHYNAGANTARPLDLSQFPKPVLRPVVRA
jgi:Concanavalin A-like lectin/glucanases superfamily